MTPLYMIEVEAFINGRKARWFLELDRDENGEDAIREAFDNSRHVVINVLEVIEDEGTCRNVTADMREKCSPVIEVEPFDHQAQRFDHQRKLRAEMV